MVKILKYDNPYHKIKLKIRQIQVLGKSTGQINNTGYEWSYQDKNPWTKTPGHKPLDKKPLDKNPFAKNPPDKNPPDKTYEH